jgi:hypothetical protein
MRTFLSLLLLATVVCAQTIAPNVVRIIPTPAGTPGGSTTGIVEFQATDATHYVGLRAPSSISTNVIWTLPSSDGSSGQCLTTNGSGVLSFGSCGSGLTPPATLTYSGTSATLTLQNTGSGYALHVTSGTAGTLFSSPVTLDSTNSLSVGGNTYTYGTLGAGGLASFNGGASVTGTLTVSSAIVLSSGSLFFTSPGNIINGNLIQGASIQGTGAFYAGSTAGVSCSGSPTGSFTSIFGLVTHC